MKIVGTKFFGHDNAVFYIDTEKKELFALSNERVTRIKHDRASVRATVEQYPFLTSVDHLASGYEDQDSLNYLLNLYYLDFVYSEIKPKYIKQLVEIKNKKTTQLIIFKNLFLSSRSYRDWLKWRVFHKAFKKPINKSELRLKINHYYSDLFKIDGKKIDHLNHHLCHAISSYAFSHFSENDTVLSFTLDGIGDGAFSALYKFNSLEKYECLAESKAVSVKNAMHKKASIGFMYADFTAALDLIPDSDEGKVEALAAFADADPSLLQQLNSMVSFDKLTIKIDPVKFAELSNLAYLKSKRAVLGDQIFAATVQTWLENTVVSYLNLVNKETGVTKICLSGGVAANIIMSLNIYERTPFKDIYVYPAMGDDGIAAGAAILTAIKHKQDISWLKNHYMPYLGPSFTSEEVLAVLSKSKDLIKYQYLGDKWPEAAANAVADGKIIALFHGREEYGPRALGNRSIVANPCNADVTKRINSTVKRRPLYQPFCPSILEEERERLFQSSFQHKHMAIAFRMKKEFWEDLPSAIHVDGTARPQFVEYEDNPNYYRLIKEVKNKTGFGVVINTSFNLHGRTMVHTPEDAITDFIDCNIDELFIEGFRVTRN